MFCGRKIVELFVQLIAVKGYHSSDDQIKLDRNGLSEKSVPTLTPSRLVPKL